MHEYHHALRVRYRECDPMGIVYHAHYVDYFEVARTELIRSLGLPYRSIEERGHLIQAVQVNVRYHSPAFYDDELIVTARIEDMPRMRLILKNEVRRKGEDTMLASGQVDLCFVDSKTKRPMRVPEYFLKALENLRLG